MIVHGYFQMIAGKPSIVGVPENWKPPTFDDWEIPEGAKITVDLPDALGG